MTRLLLDTHTFLWCVMQDPKLGTAARRQIVDPDVTVLVSAVSVWEIAIKVALGKLRLTESPELCLPAEMSSSGFLELPVTIKHALRVSQLGLFHKDPFDRLLIAQAQVEGLTLVTADAALSRYDVAILDART